MNRKPGWNIPRSVLRTASAHQAIPRIAAVEVETTATEETKPQSLLTSERTAMPPKARGPAANRPTQAAKRWRNSHSDSASAQARAHRTRFAEGPPVRKHVNPWLNRATKIRQFELLYCAFALLDVLTDDSSLTGTFVSDETPLARWARSQRKQISPQSRKNGALQHGGGWPHRHKSSRFRKRLT